MGELLPDPGNLSTGMRYIFQEAGNGAFDTSTDVLVLAFLWTNCWRSSDVNEESQQGFVLKGFTSSAAISKGTGLGVSTVDKAVTRLTSGRWIETEVVRDRHWRPRRDIFLKMDMSGHRERKQLRPSI